VVRCPKCGKESPDQARFCRFCGESLTAGGASEAYAPTRMSAEERSRRLLEQAFRLSEEGKLQPAVEACRQAIALNPVSTSAHSLLGTLYERTGDREGAIREYEQVVTLSPGSTVERRRLNELMGVPAAPTATAVSPRTERLAVTGGVVVALVLVGAIILATTQGPERSQQQVVRRAPRQAVAPTPAATEVAPSRLIALGKVRAPRPRPQRPVSPPAAARPPADRQVFGQWLGPRTFMLPAGGRERFAGLGGRAVGAPRSYPAPRVQGAVLVRDTAGPTVQTPRWQYPSGVGQVGADVSTTRVARSYYFAGDYQRAIESYRGYIVENPDAGAAPREELAWVYAESGDHASATREYQTALDQNEADLRSGRNVGSARHGARTCESAIKALETE
jgi:tetratricopeptide (TPR) repeat protein